MRTGKVTYRVTFWQRLVAPIIAKTVSCSYYLLRNRRTNFAPTNIFALSRTIGVVGSDGETVVEIRLVSTKRRPWIGRDPRPFWATHTCRRVLLDFLPASLSRAADWVRQPRSPSLPPIEEYERINRTVFRTATKIEWINWCNLCFSASRYRLPVSRPRADDLWRFFRT